MSACTFILLFTGEHGRGMECFISPQGTFSGAKCQRTNQKWKCFMRGRIYAPRIDKVFHQHSLKPINHWSLSTEVNVYFYLFFCCFFFSVSVEENPVWVHVFKKQSKFHRQSNRQKAQDQRSVNMDHTLKWERAGKALWWYASLTLALYTDML